MSEKPGKRVVTWKEYWNGRAGLYIFAPVLAGIGLYLVKRSFEHIRDGLMNDGVVYLDFLIMLLGVYLLLCGKQSLKDANAWEPVSLLNTRNAHMLPPEETLVRASDLSPTQQQAELLRAAYYGKETPSEQLLRATSEEEG